MVMRVNAGGRRKGLLLTSGVAQESGKELSAIGGVGRGIRVVYRSVSLASTSFMTNEEVSVARRQ